MIIAIKTYRMMTYESYDLIHTLYMLYFENGVDKYVYLVGLVVQNIR